MQPLKKKKKKESKKLKDYPGSLKVWWPQALQLLFLVKSVWPRLPASCQPSPSSCKEVPSGLAEWQTCLPRKTRGEKAVCLPSPLPRCPRQSQNRGQRWDRAAKGAGGGGVGGGTRAAPWPNGSSRPGGGPGRLGGWGGRDPGVPPTPMLALRPALGGSAPLLPGNGKWRHLTCLF